MRIYISTLANMVALTVQRAVSNCSLVTFPYFSMPILMNIIYALTVLKLVHHCREEGEEEALLSVAGPC